MYVLEDGGATITGHVGFPVGDLSIPDELDSLRITAIGDYAFESSILERITLPDTVLSIGNGAFQWCFSLTEITLPESLTSIGQTAWDSCKNLTRIEVSPGNPVYASLDGVLFDQSSGILYTYPCGKEETPISCPMVFPLSADTRLMVVVR